MTTLIGFQAVIMYVECPLDVANVRYFFIFVRHEGTNKLPANSYSTHCVVCPNKCSICPYKFLEFVNYDVDQSRR